MEVVENHTIISLMLLFSYESIFKHHFALSKSIILLYEHLQERLMMLGKAVEFAEKQQIIPNGENATL